MKLITKPYQEQLHAWPQSGHHIMAQYDDEKVVVYQSYRPEIGDFAFQNQYFGGAFKFTRMTWIKPNFLWMMYRNGWGKKVGQEVVLAIHLKRSAFELYLTEAVYSSYQEDIYATREHWQEVVKNSNVRLQWDPDHDPYGQKLERRAIQLGIRNEESIAYAQDYILEIEDISSFVSQQQQHVAANALNKLVIPYEKPFLSTDAATNLKLRLDRASN